jgi:hypothetical protein
VLPDPGHAYAIGGGCGGYDTQSGELSAGPVFRNDP